MPDSIYAEYRHTDAALPDYHAPRRRMPQASSAVLYGFYAAVLASALCTIALSGSQVYLYNQAAVEPAALGTVKTFQGFAVTAIALSALTGGLAVAAMAKRMGMRQKQTD